MSSWRSGRVTSRSCPGCRCRPGLPPRADRDRRPRSPAGTGARRRVPGLLRGALSPETSAATALTFEVLERAVVADHVVGAAGLLVLVELPLLAALEAGLAALGKRRSRTRSSAITATVASKALSIAASNRRAPRPPRPRSRARAPAPAQHAPRRPEDAAGTRASAARRVLEDDLGRPFRGRPRRPAPRPPPSARSAAPRTSRSRASS